MSLILAIVYLTTIGLYSRSLLQSIDSDLLQDSERVFQLLEFNPQGELDLYARTDQFINAQGYQRRLMYLIRDEKLQAIRRSAAMIYIEPPVTAKLNDYSDFTFSANEYRMYFKKYPAQGHSGRKDLYIQVIQSLDGYRQQVYHLLSAMLWLIPIPLILISTISWWIADRALKPLSRLSHTLTNIGSEQLDVRVEIENMNDEVGNIAHATNTFLDRIENAFASLKRFTSDASHELRTPLTTIRTQAEVLLSRERSADEYKQVLGSVLEEVDRLEYLSEALLQLTRGDAGILKLNRSSTNISQVLSNWVDNFLTLAEEKHITFKVSIVDDIYFNADIAILERAFINIIQNAIAYTPLKGCIEISLLQNEEQIIFKVADSGPGVADADKQAIFQRFTRLDSTRQLASGAGLGLAITQWALDLHDGEVSVTDNPHGGAIFTVFLPI